MKVNVYVLFATAMVALLLISAGTKEAKPTVGTHPGDLAPSIEFSGNGNKFEFKNQTGRYTLVNFWAAYDAESRARNVRLWNEMSKLDSSKITMYSISLDTNESIFTETVKADKLTHTNQFHDGLGEKSAFFDDYNLQKGLRNFLIDAQGIIVATNVTAETLEAIAKKI